MAELAYLIHTQAVAGRWHRPYDSPMPQHLPAALGQAGNPLQPGRSFATIPRMSVEVIIPPDKPAQAVARWQPIIRYTKKVAELEGIDLRQIILHSHPAGSMACYMAEADWEAHSITLCGGQDRQTALHELAHLLIEDYHTRFWAQELFRMHRLYLPANRVGRADRMVAKEYPKARQLYSSVYGTRPPWWVRSRD